MPKPNFVQNCNFVQEPNFVILSEAKNPCISSEPPIHPDEATALEQSQPPAQVRTP